ncbi:MAG TPA: pyridoxamine 5'-phosphate oxidase family protein [Trebonia sp.]|nr:pyridoxamine 5'-phosphate oxidase family protein [Trebonia sp.]
MQPTTERVDRRYSDADAEATRWAEAEERLATAEVAWIVTVRPDGHPHATPMVPVSLDGRVYFRTGIGEVKYANLQADTRVLVLAGDTAWNGGLDVVVEGTAAPVRDRTLLRRVAELYRARWDGRWGFDVEDGDGQSGRPVNPAVTFEVTPGKGFGFAKGDPSSQTTYRF